MKNQLKFLSFLSVLALLFSCQNKEVAAWQKFMACAGVNCVAEVVAVKDEFLKDPKPLFEAFIQTDARGEDHYIGWLYLLRDSVLLNSNYAPTEERIAMQQAIVAKAKEYEADPKYGDWAKSILTEIEMLAIASELEDAPGEGGVTGTYTFELPKDAGSGELKVLDKGDGTIRFSLLVVGGPPAHNQGTMEGTAKLNGAVAILTTEEFGGKCAIELTFMPEEVEAKTTAGGSAECGFGMNVMADGTYARVDDLDPFRAEGGDPVPAELEAIWVSTTDPKSELAIGNGQYNEIYDSKEVSSTPFRYNKSCPADCNPPASVPCLQLIGQDVVCYTVVKLDAKSLELSLMGGTGKTLVFKKKG